MTQKKTLVVGGLFALAAVLAVGCGDSGETRPIATGDGGTTGLSITYTSRCARCHGSTARGEGRFPSLPGSRTLETYIAIVRSGRGEMPMFDASQISDADLTADYQWLKTQR